MQDIVGQMWASCMYFSHRGGNEVSSCWASCSKVTVAHTHQINFPS